MGSDIQQRFVVRGHHDDNVLYPPYIRFGPGIKLKQLVKRCGLPTMWMLNNTYSVNDDGTRCPCDELILAIDYNSLEKMPDSAFKKLKEEYLHSLTTWVELIREMGCLSDKA